MDPNIPITIPTLNESSEEEGDIYYIFGEKRASLKGFLDHVEQGGYQGPFKAIRCGLGKLDLMREEVHPNTEWKRLIPIDERDPIYKKPIDVLVKEMFTGKRSFIKPDFRLGYVLQNNPPKDYLVFELDKVDGTSVTVLYTQPGLKDLKRLRVFKYVNGKMKSQMALYTAGLKTVNENE